MKLVMLLRLAMVCVVVGIVWQLLFCCCCGSGNSCSFVGVKVAIVVEVVCNVVVRM